MTAPSATRWLRIAAGLTSALLMGCSDDSTTPSTEGGLEILDLRLGTGVQATPGRLLAVNYTGWVYDASRPDRKGTQFDSSAGRGAYPFVLGAGQVIPGWDQGVVGMRVGGLRRLTIPPQLAYGSRGVPPLIPPNSTLVFEVELLSAS